MKMSMIIRGIAIAALALAMAACGTPASAPPSAPGTGTVEQGPAAEARAAAGSGDQPSAEARAAAGSGDQPSAEGPAAGADGKPVAPIAVEHEMRAEPVAGRPLEIEITIRPQQPLSAAEIRFDGGEDLRVTAPAAPLHVPLIEPDAPYSTAVTVLPTAEGALHLGVTVTGELGGTPQARNVVIRVDARGEGGRAKDAETASTTQAGSGGDGGADAAQAPAAGAAEGSADDDERVQTDPTGQAIRSLPASDRAD